jgi:hypothetical protein
MLNVPKLYSKRQNSRIKFRPQGDSIAHREKYPPPQKKNAADKKALQLFPVPFPLKTEATSACQIKRRKKINPEDPSRCDTRTPNKQLAAAVGLCCLATMHSDQRYI